MTTALDTCVTKSRFNIHVIRIPEKEEKEHETKTVQRNNGRNFLKFG